ncbi:metallophosphoesterase family protein [Lusitaniella coriacea]|uniref:metallophosphoesterase family protein n=1 Tax=Lusitaniella coriacea TaxID=1983105 RepID=UPI003CEEDB52
MKFVLDPSIATKIEKMKQRVRWKESAILSRGIDQTSLVLDEDIDEDGEFSFLVIGDSGTGYHGGHNPQRKIAERLLEERDRARFILHTGDVIYLVGSREYYPANFIKPYREFLVGHEKSKKIAYDRMTFNLPFLPVPGNHDYYDLPFIYGLLAQMAYPLRRLLRSHIDFDVGWHGSGQGDAYARAFIDYLQAFNLPGQLEQHLDSHYTAKTSTGRCLHYELGQFTRLPNRYYTFRYSGIDFFALDSNTFNSPAPLPDTAEGEVLRRQLQQRLQELEQRQQEIIAASAQLNRANPEESEEIDDNKAKIEQIEESQRDIEKQLGADEENLADFEQLVWLQQRLIESWQTEGVRGRVIYFHHPPYVTEATKWDQGQTLAIRDHLRQVLDGVAKAIGTLAGGRPLVDLVLCGHAHCLEYLRTGETGYADSHINWIVCGGSGYSLRRQREEGSEIMESGEVVARSRLFLGRHGRGKKKRRPYSAARIDVSAGTPPQFTLQPLVAERCRQKWYRRTLEPLQLPTQPHIE